MSLGLAVMREGSPGGGEYSAGYLWKCDPARASMVPGTITVYTKTQLELFCFL